MKWSTFDETLHWLFPKLYWKGRRDGWFACETLIIKRLKKAGFSKEEIEKLVA